MKKYLLYFAVFSLVFVSCETDDDDDDIDRTTSFQIIHDNDTISYDNFGAVHNADGTFIVSGFTHKEEVNEGEGVEHHYKTRNIVFNNILFKKGKYSFVDFHTIMQLTERKFLDDEIYAIDFLATPSDEDSILAESYFYIDDISTEHTTVSGFFEVSFFSGDTIPTEIEGEFRNIEYSEE